MSKCGTMQASEKAHIKAQLGGRSQISLPGMQMTKVSWTKCPKTAGISISGFIEVDEEPCWGRC